MVGLYFSCMFEPTPSTSVYATSMPGSATFPFVSLCYSNCDCSGSVGFVSLFVSKPILESMETAKVNQLYSCQNDYFGSMGESEWHSVAHLMPS